MSIFDFAAGFEDGAAQADRALWLTAAILGASSELKQKPSILGAGLMISPIREMLSSLNVVVAMDVRLEPGIQPTQTTYLSELDNTFGMFAGVMGGAPDWLKQVRAFGMFEPELHLQPADRVQATLGGSAGCSLAWTGGSGFAMAGHVAPSAGAAVNQHSSQVGTVAWANNPTGRGTSVEADFSVIEIIPGVHFSSPYSTYSHGRPYDPIAVVKPSGTPFPSSIIVGMFPAMALPSHNSTLGDIYMTGGQISSAGDSGTPVINNSGGLIGHVIGASSGITTLVQDLSYQIKTANSVFPNLRI
jgi:hypothetical protein